MVRRRRFAFTLIELLVVVAIIALLIAVLLPSLAMARSQARGTKCLASLRSIGQGWSMYADENRDILVPSRPPDAGGGTSNALNVYDVGYGRKFRPRWLATIARHIGTPALSNPSTTDDRQDYDSALYQCAEAADWADERNHGYGYNYQFLGNARRVNGQFRAYPVRRGVITHAAITVVGADAIGTPAGTAAVFRREYRNGGTDILELGNHAYTLDPPRLLAGSDRGTGDVGSPRSGVSDRHRGRTNVLYADGRAVAETVFALGYRLQPDGSFVDQQTVADPPGNERFSGTGRDDDPPGSQ